MFVVIAVSPMNKATIITLKVPNLSQVGGYFIYLSFSMNQSSWSYRTPKENE